MVEPPDNTVLAYKSLRISTSHFMMELYERGLEHGLWCTESFVANGDNLAIRKLVALLQAGAGGSSLHFLFEIQSNITELLFDVTHNLALGCGGE
ncbi:unnamed protein product [Pocillopora meandrina]|uniref:Uncharacterized protein n=1 Tax=Pocillopora meandrina TaxID=46732 RepID=A0AAU9Y549_9CNID|nr:unnamed protein product [Pocillopora meandrina]